jgi:hypothetical protein
MTTTELLQKLDRTGGVAYRDGSSQVFCWCGVLAGHVWYHRGDKPAWGLPVEAMEPLGEFAIKGNVNGKLALYLTTFDEAPEIELGKAITTAAGMREEMTREAAIAMLGDPPATTKQPPTASDTAVPG